MHRAPDPSDHPTAPLDEPNEPLGRRVARRLLQLVALLALGFAMRPVSLWLSRIVRGWFGW
jgi:hypothetical protein